MSKLERQFAVLQKNPRNVKFRDFKRVVVAFGFYLDYINGSHHIYKHPIAHKKINVQKVGNNAKPYQVRQFLEIVHKYNLKI